MLYVRKAGVIGAGTMGAAIAEVLAFNDVPVVLKDVEPALVERGLARVRGFAEELLTFQEGRYEKERDRLSGLGLTLSPEQDELLRSRLKPKFTRERLEAMVSRVEGTVEYSSFRDVDLVVEAAFESVPVKRTIFEELDRVLPDHAIVGTNTSSLSVSRIARGLRLAPRALVTHFFNPPYTLPLVEVASGVETREEAVTDALDFLQKLKNHRYPMLPLRVKEVPGYLVNRLLIPMLNEACFALDEGVASARDLDQALKAGAGLPMGPLELADMIGLDICLEVAEVLQREYGDPKYRPSLALRRLVDAGHLGRKTHRGFYEYD
jgi:3-hydroxybutyryl-CoA dehydrogenase